MRNHTTNEFSASQAKIDGKDVSRTSWTDALPIIIVALLPAVFCAWKIHQFFQQ
jgi:hypothetical protein